MTNWEATEHRAKLWGQEAGTTLLEGGVGGQINLTSLIASHSTSVVVIVLSAGLTCALAMVGCCC